MAMVVGTFNSTKNEFQVGQGYELCDPIRNVKTTMIIISNVKTEVGISIYIWNWNVIFVSSLV